MHKKTLLVSLLSCAALLAGCQSAPPVPLVVECQKPPAPPAWAMEPTAPSFTQRLLQILSE